jgi:hypothetical protein
MPLTEFGPEGTIRFGADFGPCVWCGRPSEALLFSPALGRDLPLHPTCGLVIIVKHKRWRAGRLRPGNRSDDKALEMFGPMPTPLQRLEPGPPVL